MAEKIINVEGNAIDPSEFIKTVAMNKSSNCGAYTTSSHSYTVNGTIVGVSKATFGGNVTFSGLNCSDNKVTISFRNNSSNTVSASTSCTIKYIEE